VDSARASKALVAASLFEVSRSGHDLFFSVDLLDRRWSFIDDMVAVPGVFTLAPC
jgi:hypothetical protein